MHIEDPNDNNSKIFVDTMEALGLKQHVDLIFTEVKSQN